MNTLMRQKLQLKTVLADALRPLKKLRSLSYYLKDLVNSDLFRATYLSGNLPGSDTTIKVLFLGNAEQTYMVNDIFFDPSTLQQQDLGPINPLRQQQEQSYPELSDLDVVVTNHIFWARPPKKGVYLVPMFLESIAPLPATIEELLSQLPETERRKTRKALKAGFEIEFGETETDYREFYEQMWVPLMKRRHDANAEIHPFEQLYTQAQAARSSLIFVKSGGKRLGGIHVLWPQLAGSPAFFNKVGIIDQVSQDAVQLNLVNIALYYQMFNAAIQRGITAIDLGVVPPILNNGLLQFKGKWGANCHYLDHTYYKYQIKFCSHKQQEILQSKYLIHIQDNKLVATVGVKGEEVQTPSFEGRLKSNSFPNLKQIYLTYPDGKIETRCYSNPEQQISGQFQ
jgi:hypothetical protein